MGGGIGDGLSIEKTDSDQLEHTMAKFDDTQAPIFEVEEAAAFAEKTTEAAAMVSETPWALNQMMEKFDMLHSSSIDEPHQNKMMAKFDRLQNPAITTPRMDGDDDLEKADDTEVYRDNRLFEVMSPCSQGGGGGGIEVQQSNEQHENDPAFASYSNSNSYSSNEMFADIAQFRSAESHLGTRHRFFPSTQWLWLLRLVRVVHRLLLILLLLEPLLSLIPRRKKSSSNESSHS